MGNIEQDYQLFWKKSKCLRHEIDETGINTNKDKVITLLEKKHPENQKNTLDSRAITVCRKIHTENVEKDRNF